MKTPPLRLPRLSALLALVLAGCGGQEPGTLSGSTMGTTWSLRAIGVTERTRALIQAHLDEREAVLSHWRADSALSRLNASDVTDWQPVPRVLVEVVRLARRIAEETEGALDITLAPVVEQYGFAPALGPAPIVTGWQHLEERPEPPALRKNQPNLRINVASVTEGFVMDELVAMLKAEGHASFLLEIGGEVAAIGTAPGGGPWRVGIQTPGAAAGEAMQSLPLMDQCAATSGSYRQQKKGVSHLIDPRTRQPIRHGLTSVTVLHSSCALADGYATALMVLGPQRGRRVAERLGLRVIWIEAAE